MTATLDSLLSGEIRPGLFEWRGDPTRDVAGEARSLGWAVRELDTTGVGNAEQLYDRIAVMWDLPEWFGRNLDAVWDVLGDLAVSPLLLVWTGYPEMAETDPELTQTLLELLRDAATQARAMAVVVMQPPALIDLDGLR